MSLLSKGVLAAILGCAAVDLVIAWRHVQADEKALQPTVRSVPDWRAYGQRGHRIGSATAPVSVVAFIDYECPFSRTLLRQLQALRQEMPATFSVVYRHYPLPSHRYAASAALAAECAGEQGSFEQFHNRLSETSPRIFATKPWTLLAAEAGVADIARFGRCLNSGDPGVALAADTTAGRRLKIVGTPTLLVNEQEFVGLPSDLAKILKRAVKSADRQR